MPQAINSRDRAFFQGDNLRSRPLDGFIASRWAYGLRRLLTSWTGPVVRVALSNDTFWMDLFPKHDGFVDWADALILVQVAITEALSHTVYVKHLYEQNGSGEHAAFTSKGAGNNDPPVFLENHAPFLMPTNNRPAMLWRNGTAGIIAGGNHQIVAAGRRGLTHAVIGRATADTDSGGGSRIASGAILFGNSWAGAPGGQDTALGYASDFGAAYAGGAIQSDRDMGSYTTHYRTGGATWGKDEAHVVSARRDGDTTVQCMRNGVSEGTTPVGNVAAANSSSGIFNFTGISAGDLDPYRCSELVLWDVDPGAIQAELYRRSAADYRRGV